MHRSRQRFASALAATLFCTLASCASSSPDRFRSVELTSSRHVPTLTNKLTTANPTGADLSFLAVAPRVGRDGKSIGDTSIRLEFFSESIELEELELDYDGGGRVMLLDTERDRVGFRGSFGRGAGGFFQVFVEDFKNDNRVALPVEFTNFGVGGGAIGTPRLGGNDTVAVVLPYKLGVDFAFGVEDSPVLGDEELVYLGLDAQLGVGVQVVGLQATIGARLDQFYGLYESDNPASPAHLDPADLTGGNFGGFVELLFKPERAAITARIRVLFGEIEGVEFGLGLAF